MPLPFFTAALAAWRAAYTDAPGASASRVADAVVKLSIKAVADARTADTLGAEREGSGIVIDAKRGLILTIGYLVLEAASILVMTRDARIYAANVAGFDHASGFGLIRTLGGISSAGGRARRFGVAARARDGESRRAWSSGRILEGCGGRAPQIHGLVGIHDRGRHLHRAAPIRAQRGGACSTRAASSSASRRCG